MRPIMILCGCWFSLLVSEATAQPGHGTLEIRVLNKTSGKPLPCRIHLSDAAGKPLRAGKLPFWRDHFVCNGTVSLELAPGSYTYEVEHGPEFSRRAGKCLVKENETSNVKLELERLIDLTAEGWWPGDLHIHRPVEEIELLMQAEELHIGPVITWWNGRNQWASPKRRPEKLLTRFDGNRYYHVMAGEDEREGGALLYFNLAEPLSITGASREFPSPVKFLTEARQQKNVWVDVEKPFWWDVPVWLAHGEVDSIGLANNHMCRSSMSELEAWGKPRDRQRLPPPLGNGYWSQEIYYHILNCGIRIPPSAGSASGVLPNPVGYNRVYVHTGPKEFSYESWWQGLRAGRCFVTNGPLLRVEAAGELPGHVFTAAEGKDLDLDIKVKLLTQDPVPFLEIVHDGRVVRRVPFEDWSKSGTLGKLHCKSSGWFLVRAITDNPKTFRFASTGPYYVEVGPTKRRLSKTSARFFLDWVEERIGRIKLDNAEQRQAVLRYHEMAKKFWSEQVGKANAE